MSYSDSKSVRTSCSTRESADRASISASRCVDEALELVDAINTTDRAHVLDEIVDVLYYIDKVASEFNISASAIQAYAARKGRLRTSTGKNKALEIALARLVLSAPVDIHDSGH